MVVSFYSESKKLFRADVKGRVLLLENCVMEEWLLILMAEFLQTRANKFDRVVT